jgi:hypothetical protein
MAVLGMKMKCPNNLKLFLPIFVFLMSTAMVYADNAVSVANSSNSFPVSVEIDTYIIQNPSFLQGLMGAQYFSLESSAVTTISFDTFLEGEVFNEMGTGNDINGFIRVEALKAQAVAGPRKIQGCKLKRA